MLVQTMLSLKDMNGDELKDFPSIDIRFQLFVKIMDRLTSAKIIYVYQQSYLKN